MTKEKGMELLSDRVSKKIFSNSEIGRNYYTYLCEMMMKHLISFIKEMDLWKK